MWGVGSADRGGEALRTGRTRRNRRTKAPNRPLTPRFARQCAPPCCPATPARAWGGEARANGLYSHLHAPMPHLRPTWPAEGRRSRAPAPAPARARSAHRLPSARCYPGPARASAGGGLSARRLRKAAAQRLREGGHAEKTLRARRSPGRSAPAPAAAQRDLSAPRILPSGRNLRAQWRRS